MYLFSQRLAESASCRHNGNRLYSTSHFLAALDAYTLALSLCPPSFPHEQAAIYNNISATHIKLGNHAEAVRAASRALELRPTWSKALYRRARGWEGLGNWASLVAAFDDYLVFLELADKEGKVEGIAAEEIERVREKLKWFPGRIEEQRKRETEEMAKERKFLRVA
jgi:tetratricopeptide (TPR) repeat protein